MQSSVLQQMFASGGLVADTVRKRRGSSFRGRGFSEKDQMAAVVRWHARCAFIDSRAWCFFFVQLEAQQGKTSAKKGLGAGAASAEPASTSMFPKSGGRWAKLRKRR